MGWTRSTVTTRDGVDVIEVVTWANGDVRMSRFGEVTQVAVQGAQLGLLDGEKARIIQFIASELFDRLEVSRLEQIPIRDRRSEVVKDE